MKLYLLPLVAVAALTAAHTVSANEAGEALFKSKPCVACHTVDTQLVGPAMKAVAAKHADQDAAEAQAQLVKSIKEGSAGVYGPIPMPPNQVTDEEAKQLAEWILSLK